MPTNHAVIRAAGTDDAAAVLGLWKQARSPAAVTPDTEEALAALMEQPGSVLLVTEVDRHIVASLVVAWDGWRGNMYRLAVLPRLRRQGIARRLVEAGHEHLRSVGARRITALVAHDEENAVGLWLSAGYERDEQISRFVRNL
jgi:ribosomal protein S18 acetylase RimI-like enzyme